jgi:hypothetical protein
MLAKGIFLGIVVSVVSLFFYMRSLSPQTGVSRAPTSVDIRTIEFFVRSFFGGITIGVGFVAAVIFAGSYALRYYALHKIGLRP